MDCMKTPPKILAKYRRLGKNQNPEELRVTVGEFNGIRYLDFRIWEGGRNGQWFPTTRGVSVRELECDDLADVITQGGKLLAGLNAERRRGPKQPAASVATPVEASRAVPPWE